MDKDNNPTFIFRDGMTADKEYIEWLKELKARYRQSQVTASVKVNTAMLEYYWCLGRDIIQLKAESKWGSGFFNQLSLDLKSTFPNETGFSVTNLKYMRRWYAFYNESFLNRQQRVDELESENRQQRVDELKMPVFFGQIPWGHHIQIITKCQSLDEALFYINKIIEEGWKRVGLRPK